VEKIERPKVETGATSSKRKENRKKKKACCIRQGERAEGKNLEKKKKQVPWEKRNVKGKGNGSLQRVRTKGKACYWGGGGGGGAIKKSAGGWGEGRIVHLTPVLTKMVKRTLREDRKEGGVLEIEKRKGELKSKPKGACLL